MSIIDTPFNTESRIPCLLSQGVRTVIRYYNFSNSHGFPEKRMELAEAQALAANGMQIAVVFQQRQNQMTDFTEAKGVAAGRRAYRHAQDNISQPAGSGIYFAVDFDASTVDIEDNIARYFEGVKRAFAEESGGNPDYRIGAYGSGFVCTTLTSKGLIEFTWLAMSRGFRGTRESLSAGKFISKRGRPFSALLVASGKVGFEFAPEGSREERKIPAKRSRLTPSHCLVEMLRKPRKTVGSRR